MPRHETTPLLEEREESSEGNVELNPHKAAISQVEAIDAILVLPVAFLAALGMAATAVTSIYAYASLLCKNLTNCGKSEQSKYVESVALAATIANFCGVLVLGSLERLTRNHRKAGLVSWIILRSLSVVALVAGVYSNSIAIALSGRVFEGFASDNLLHFNLNAIYVRIPNQPLVPRLIGTSLALYMIGISISPAVAGIFPNFVTSFFMALGTFALGLLYVLIFVGRRQNSLFGKDTATNPTQKVGALSRDGLKRNSCSLFTRTVLSPLRPFYTRPTSILSGMALLVYNLVQSYAFSLIMVHTSLDFDFTSKQNGQLLSIVHAVSASYLFLVLFGIPEISRRYHRTRRLTDYGSGKRDVLLALISFVVQILALVGFANAAKAWEIYLVSALFALGLATPSFIKSHFLGFFEKDDAAEAMGAMTLMETFGGLLSPLILGSWQAMWPGVGVFYGAAGMMAFATSLLCAAAIVLHTHPTVKSDECSVRGIS